jgi:hypothetical protein
VTDHTLSSITVGNVHSVGASAAKMHKHAKPRVLAQGFFIPTSPVRCMDGSASLTDRSSLVCNRTRSESVARIRIIRPIDFPAAHLGCSWGRCARDVAFRPLVNPAMLAAGA